jgi:uncharacterized protein YgiM (DUF1202 family)
MLVGIGDITYSYNSGKKNAFFYILTAISTAGIGLGAWVLLERVFGLGFWWCVGASTVMIITGIISAKYIAPNSFDDITRGWLVFTLLLLGIAGVVCFFNIPRAVITENAIPREIIIVLAEVIFFHLYSLHFKVISGIGEVTENIANDIEDEMPSFIISFIFAAGITLGGWALLGRAIGLGTLANVLLSIGIFVAAFFISGFYVFKEKYDSFRPARIWTVLLLAAAGSIGFFTTMPERVKIEKPVIVENLDPIEEITTETVTPPTQQTPTVTTQTSTLITPTVTPQSPAVTSETHIGSNELDELVKKTGFFANLFNGIKGLFSGEKKEKAPVEAIAAQTVLTVKTATVTSDGLNMRKTPSGSGDVVKTLRRGDTITVTGNVTENGWMPVAHNGDSGYVSSQYVTVTESALPTTTITADKLPMRKKATLFSKKIKTLVKGDVVAITGDIVKKKWLPVSHNGDDGYISAPLVETKNEQLTPPPQTTTTQTTTTPQTTTSTNTTTSQTDNTLKELQDLAAALSHFNRGETFSGQFAWDSAIPEYNEAIRLFPDYTEAYNSRGVAYKRLSQYEQAIANFNEAIRLNPNFAIAYFNRGESHYLHKLDFNRAIADYSEAIRLNPNNSEFYLYRALAYHNRGNFSNDTADIIRAIADYTEVLRLNPDEYDVYRNRSDAYRAISDNTRADADSAKYQEMIKQFEIRN